MHACPQSSSSPNSVPSATPFQFVVIISLFHHILSFEATQHNGTKKPIAYTYILHHLGEVLLASCWPVVSIRLYIRTHTYTHMSASASLEMCAYVM